MQAPEIPLNESARLNTLHGLNILDTPSEDRFDRYTRLSARVFDVPIALVSLVDQYRQWFKSKHGLEASETPRDLSFCGHAILGDEVFEVRNARRDPRFRDNPLVVGQPHIRFYAGAPLICPNGHKLGTLCIIDRVRRYLDDGEKKILADMADMIVGEIVGYIESESGLMNRNGLRSLGSKALAGLHDQHQLNTMLFDLGHIRNTSIDDTTTSRLAGLFANMLRQHFPKASVISHIGCLNFCVVTETPAEENYDKAIENLTSATLRILKEESLTDSQPIHAGTICYDRDSHETFDEVIREADALFYQRALNRSCEVSTTPQFVAAT